MHCRDITDLAFEVISGDLIHVERKHGPIETVNGTHPEFGASVLLRDASRCMVLVERPASLDLTLAELACRSGCLVGPEPWSSRRH